MSPEEKHKALVKLKLIGTLSLPLCGSDNETYGIARKINKLAREVYNIIESRDSNPDE
jgi:galactose-1-phosphate uridylyltransferase